MSFPVYIQNIFELLSEDGEAAPRARTDANEEKEAPRAQVKGSNQNAASTKGNSQGNAKPQGSKDGARKTNESRPPRQENRPPRSIDGTGSNEPQVGGGEFTEAPVRRERFDRTRGDNHRSNSDRRTRGVDQVGEIGGKRVFDRRSGTGRGREQKKGGAGRGNWGKEGEGETAENWDTTEEGKEAAPKKEAEKVVEEAPVEKDPVQEELERLAREEQEKEDRMITLDAYYKQKEATQVKIELPQARKANEGVDQKELNKWNSYQVLKKEEDVIVLKKEDSHEKSGNKSTVPLDQVFNIRDPPKPRDDRPFRRGGRNGGSGGNRGGNSGGNSGGSGASRGGNGGSRGGKGGNRAGGRGGKRGEAPHFDLNTFPTLAPKA